MERLNAVLEWADSMRTGELCLGFVLGGTFAVEVRERDGEPVVALRDLSVNPQAEVYDMLDKAVGR